MDEKKTEIPRKSSYKFKLIDGVFQVFHHNKLEKNCSVLLFDEFLKDLSYLMELITYKSNIKSKKRWIFFFIVLKNRFGPAKTYCHRSLQLLQARFHMHILLNEKNELNEVRTVPHRDFYNVRKGIYFMQFIYEHSFFKLFL